MQLLNAFSLNMVVAPEGTISYSEISLEEAQAGLAAGFESAVGHADTAAVFGGVLGMQVPANRATVALEKGDSALVGQYRGPRLAEGATRLPDGATIVWYRVEIAQQS